MQTGTTKRFLCALCAIVSLFLVGGCSHTEPAPSAPAPPAGSTPVQEATQSGSAATAPRSSRPKMDTSQ